MATTDEATQVVLHDEGTRRALESALWFHVALNVVGETALRNLAYDAYRDAALDVPDASAVDQAFDELEMVRTEISRVRAAEIGESIEISVGVHPLTEALSDCRILVEEDEDFWGCPPEERERRLATRDGAVRLMADLAPPEAVA